MKILTSKYRNYWVMQNKIPLGQMENGTTVFKIMPRISDFLIISAMTGRGKSVILRLIYWFISQIRPIIVFDWEGEDHKHSYYPKEDSDGLPEYTYPQPVNNSVFFSYPSKNIRDISSTKEDYEIEVIPCIKDYIADELRGMGFPTGAAMELTRIINTYPKKAKNMKQLLEFVRNFPTNERESKKAERQGSDYNENDTLPSQTKQSLLKHLYTITENNQFSLEKTEDKVLEAIFRGKNVFLNFRGNVDLARVEVARIITLVISMRKKYPNTPAPYFIFEESDNLFPRFIIDQNERTKIQYVLNTAVQSVLRARKLKIGMAFCTPTISNLHKLIIDSSYEKIFGEMAGYDLSEARRILGIDRAELIRTLKFNRYLGVREFLYFNEFKQYFRFVPYACPQKYHRE